MKRLFVIALAILLAGLIGGWASAEVLQRRQTIPVDPPVIVSGADVGFRIEGRRGGVRVGSIVVRVDGKWVATGPSEGWHQATTAANH